MSTQNPELNEHDDKVNKAIDKLLNQILGHEAAQIIYSYLESDHSIQKDEIAQNLNSFNWALEEYLGSGAVIIEKAILENLEENTDIDFDRSRILKLA